MIQAMPSPPEREERDHSPLLRRRDQQLLGGVLLAAGLGIAGWWWLSGGLRGRLTEWERMPSRMGRFEVDVNTASWPELAELPEVGETLARRIVEHREAHGPFRAPEDLADVKGIGEKKLAKMRPYLGRAAWAEAAPRGDEPGDGGGDGKAPFAGKNAAGIQ
ncbi:MAG: ComEA family DNA-binding protein [Thermoguttaceae bacterium]